MSSQSIAFGNKYYNQGYSRSVALQIGWAIAKDLKETDESKKLIYDYAVITYYAEKYKEVITRVARITKKTDKHIIYWDFTRKAQRTCIKKNIKKIRFLTASEIANTQDISLDYYDNFLTR
jgi:hypothetical protein